MPCSPAQTALWRVPDPHQMRSASPGDWGCTASIASPGRTPAAARPTPAQGTRRRTGADPAAPADRAAKLRRLLTCLLTSQRVAKRLGAVPGGLGRAAAAAQLEATARQQVCRRRFLGHVQRVLVAHVDDARADLDPARADADRREQRERG